MENSNRQFCFEKTKTPGKKRVLPGENAFGRHLGDVAWKVLVLPIKIRKGKSQKARKRHRSWKVRGALYYRVFAR